MLFKNDIEKAKEEAKDQKRGLWEEEKACFKAGFYSGLATAGGIALAGLALLYKVCKKSD